MKKGNLSTLEETFHAKEDKPDEPTSLISDILVDADVLVALAKNDDSNHKKALEISEGLQEEGAFWYFSPFTVAEAATVLSHKVSHESACDFLREIRNLDILIIYLHDRDVSLADKWFLKQKKKGTSYFDCYNMALMDRYSKTFDAIFSFDKVYKDNNFRLVEI